jgi:hypothetical protein
LHPLHNPLRSSFKSRHPFSLMSGR